MDLKVAIGTLELDQQQHYRSVVWLDFKTSTSFHPLTLVAGFTVNQGFLHASYY